MSDIQLNSESIWKKKVQLKRIKVDRVLWTIFRLSFKQNNKSETNKYHLTELIIRIYFKFDHQSEKDAQRMNFY